MAAETVVIDGAVCQLVTLVSQLIIGKAGVLGDQCGLGQSKYRNNKIENFLLNKVILRKRLIVTRYAFV